MPDLSRIKASISEKQRTLERESEAAVRSLILFSDGDASAEIQASESLKLASATLSEMGDIAWNALCDRRGSTLFPSGVPRRIYFPRAKTAQDLEHQPYYTSLEKDFPELLNSLRALQIFVRPEAARCHDSNNIGKHVVLREIELKQPDGFEIAEGGVELDLGAGASATGDVAPNDPTPKTGKVFYSPEVSWTFRAGHSGLESIMVSPKPLLVLFSLRDVGDVVFTRQICWAMEWNIGINGKPVTLKPPENHPPVYVPSAYGILTTANKLRIPSWESAGSTGNPVQDLVAAKHLYERTIERIFDAMD